MLIVLIHICSHLLIFVYIYPFMLLITYIAYCVLSLTKYIHFTCLGTRIELWIKSISILWALLNNETIYLNKSINIVNTKNWFNFTTTPTVKTKDELKDFNVKNDDEIIKSKIEKILSMYICRILFIQEVWMVVYTFLVLDVLFVIVYNVYMLI